MSDAVYDLIQPRAMIGMKVDSMDDNVDSYPALNEIGFGRVCTFGAPGVNNHRVRAAIADLPVAGIALQDHVVGAYGPVYRQHDAVSVLTRGRVWAQVDPTAANNAGVLFGNQVSFNPNAANAGMVGRTGANASPAGWFVLRSAVFRSGVVIVPPLWPSMSLGGGLVALVEINVPPYQILP